MEPNEPRYQAPLMNELTLQFLRTVRGILEGFSKYDDAGEWKGTKLQERLQFEVWMRQFEESMSESASLERALKASTEERLKRTVRGAPTYEPFASREDSWK